MFNRPPVGVRAGAVANKSSIWPTRSSLCSSAPLVHKVADASRDKHAEANALYREKRQPLRQRGEQPSKHPAGDQQEDDALEPRIVFVARRRRAVATDRLRFRKQSTDALLNDLVARPAAFKIDHPPVRIAHAAKPTALSTNSGSRR